MTDHDSVSLSARQTQHISLDPEFVKAMESVCRSISAAGYDPYRQLTAYLHTGLDVYITRTGNARAIIESLDRTKIQLYVSQQFHK